MDDIIKEMINVYTKLENVRIGSAAETILLSRLSTLRTQQTMAYRIMDELEQEQEVAAWAKKDALTF